MTNSWSHLSLARILFEQTNGCSSFLDWLNLKHMIPDVRIKQSQNSLDYFRLFSLSQYSLII